jgi:hypothetical protein
VRKKIVSHDIVRQVLYFALCLPADTAVPLSHAEEGLLRGENCTGQLNVQRNGVAVVRKKYQKFGKN